MLKIETKIVNYLKERINKLEKELKQLRNNPEEFALVVHSQNALIQALNDINHIIKQGDSDE